MSRSITLIATALLAALSMVIVFGAIAAARTPTSPANTRAANSSSASTSSTSGKPTCFSWDFLNNTGQDLDGVRIGLKGIPSITEVYTGTFNPFGAPSSSGYDAVTDTYNLTFTNGSAAASDLVRLGACADRSSLRLGSPSPAFYWTLTGTRTLPDPLSAGLSLNWVDQTHVQIDLFNEQAISLTLWSLNVLDPVQKLALEDLGDDIAMLLPLASEVVTDPVTLLPSASQSFNAAVLLGNHPYVIEAVLSAEDDPGNLIHVLAQSTSPTFYIYLPLTLKNF
jgi:hypothetical protein